MLGKCSTVGLYPQTFYFVYACVCFCTFVQAPIDTRRRKTSILVIDVFERADVYAEI